MQMACQFRPSAFLRKGRWIFHPAMITTQFIVTALVLAGAVAVIARMVIIEKRPRSDLNPRLIPTTPVMIICAFVALLALVHLVNMAGVHTGR